ncbi:MAG: hypothetical protein JWO63_1645 [Frankiales bacterium]|nr:hypothetical protein [Frankiales bacterium]
MASRFLAFLAGGAIFGVEHVLGVDQVLGQTSTASGLLGVSLYCLAYGLTMTVRTSLRLRQLGPLNSAQRAEVLRAVDHGTSPEDPVLARAVLAQVALVRRDAYPLRFGSWGFLALAGLPIVLLAVAVGTHDAAVLALQGITVGLWQARLKGPKGAKGERQLLSAEFAERQARNVLGLPRLSRPSGVAIAAESWASGRPARGAVSVAAIAAAVLILAMHASADMAGGNNAKPATAASLKAAGYRDYGTLEATTIWLRVDGKGELQLRATGAITGSCSWPTHPTASGRFISWEYNVCNEGHFSRGSIFAYVGDSTFHGVQVSLSDGTTVRQAGAIDVGPLLTGERLLLVLVARSGLSEQDVTFN